MSAIRTMFLVYGLNTVPLKDERLSLYIKSLKINAKFTPITSQSFPKIISAEILQQSVEICSTLPDPVATKHCISFISFVS